MFDMGFTEMMLIGIVALIVIGPDRLPGVARTAGKYFARLRNFMMNVRADVESELKSDELREMLDAQKQELQSLKKVVDDAGDGIDLSGITNEISGIANSIDDAKPVDSAKPETSKKSKTKVKSTSKAAVKSKARAKPGTPSKLKPKSGTKAKVMAKAKVESKWTSAIVPPATATNVVEDEIPRAKSKATKPTKVKQ